jgi:ABC-type lipoprotein export system ATPase subunit
MVPKPTPQPAAFFPEMVGAIDGRTDPNGARAPVVELRGLTRTYGSDPPVQALRSVDLTIRGGEWMAIVGPSGSGKSTLLNILGCLDRPTSGSYLIEGIDAAGLTDDERAAVRAQMIGFVFQTFHLLSHRTALENVMLAEVYSGGGRTGREARALAALERVGMVNRRDFLPTKLSGGEQQRVAIARALLGTPRLLL